MNIYIPLCRYWIAQYRYVLVFIVPHVDIELEDNKQFISNIPRIFLKHFREDTLAWAACPPTPGNLANSDLKSYLIF